MILLKTVVVVFVAFVLSYLPVTVIYAFDKELTVYDPIYVISVIMLWCWSSINWMIYGLMNRQFLTAYRYVICCFRDTFRLTTDNGSGSNLSLQVKFSSQRPTVNGATTDGKYSKDRDYHMSFIDT